MVPILLCFVALAASYWAGRRSLGGGLSAVLCVGYGYGIVRANLLNPASHFIFDASLAGLYISQMGRSAGPSDPSRSALYQWMAMLIGWPMLVCLMPFQPLLVSIVGLRGNVFFLPVCLLAARLKRQDLSQICTALAGLNLLVLAFAGAEYFGGIEKFYPVSAVTRIIYASRDVAGFQYYRIPATFTGAHAYAGTMVTTLPFLIGAWSQVSIGFRRRLFMLAGVAAAFLGILLANARSHVAIGALIAIVALFQIRTSPRIRLAWCALLGVAVFLTVSNERFQRVLSLSDTDAVSSRIQGSVNRTFFEILAEHPMGNGLGGGGTSMPSFVEGMIHTPIAMESEYARILLEQGIIGLLLWVGFLLWFLTSAAAEPGPWQTGRKLARCCCTAYLATGMIGLGMLTSIPQTVLMLLALGWVAVRPVAENIPLPTGPIVDGSRLVHT